jgi:hypothetical protein
MTVRSRSLKSTLRTSTAVVTVAAACLALSPARAIVGNDAYTPAQLVDTINVTGVGEMVVDQQNGYIGTCTASLINPRTVIFAAHCVNEGDDDFKPASSYGAAFGGTPIAFFFNANNNVSGNSAIGHWLFGTANSDPYLTRPGENTYNSNYVIYNTKSTELGFGNNFLQADIAMAALDTPAVGIPTWTLLFSPITEPTHATVIGYGRTGSGSLGATGSDYRRRVAENTISFLGSLDDVDSFLFGVSDGLPQNLYQIDFNDPKFGTDEANIYDFNIFHDAAQAKEAITAPGDSGGPLVIDQMFSQQVIAAVLSGGSRYYYSQPSASYGTTSFYQPLYLFWDWIVTNNPYKYVSAKVGDGSWTDPNHWVMNLDPNYVTIDANGNLVNALPTTPAEGVPDVDGVNTPKFGEVCYYDDCYDIGTGEYKNYANATKGGSEIYSSPDHVQFTKDAADTVASDPAMGLVKQWLESMAGSSLAPSAIMSGLPTSGAPGSSGFVPNDTDGDPTTGAPARYYDVTLSADGTTTLSNANIIVDRLTINGAKSGLNIAANGLLGVWIDTTMYAGNLNVDGVLVSNGDFALMGGVLTGTGIVAAPYTTSVLGTIAPGRLGTTGTLTFAGSVVLASKSGLAIDIAPTATDRLDVYEGTLSLGGTLIVNPINGFTPKWHQTKIIATGDVISGKFASIPDTIEGVLYPTAATVAATGYDTEVVSFEAAPFKSVLGEATTDQLQVGSILDADRAGSYAALSAIYDAVDPLSGAGLGGALDTLIPNAARSTPQSTLLLTGAHTGYLWQYLGAMDPSADAKVAVQTGALKLAQNSQAGSFEMRSFLSRLGSEGGCSGGMVCATDASTGGGSGAMALPKGIGAFLIGQKIDGNAKIGGSGGKADIDGYLIAAGADTAVLNNIRVGLSFGYGEADTTLRDQPARSKISSKQVVAYGLYMNGSGYFVDGFAGYGFESIHTQHQVTLGATTYLLDGRTSATTPLGGLQVGRAFSDVLGGTIRPAVGVQYGRVQVDGYTETGGAPALAVSTYGRQSSTARIGFDSNWAVDVSGIVLKPQLHAFFVANLGGHENALSAGLAAAPSQQATFEIGADSNRWADLGLRLDAAVCDNATLGFYFNANPGNVGGTYTAVGGSLRVSL